MDFGQLFLSYPSESKSADGASPISQRFRAESVLRGAVEAHGFLEHARRSPPSNLPGVDLALPDHHRSETLPIALKSVVLSPVAGRVLPSGTAYGTVRILDAGGFEHRILHMHLQYEGPVGGAVFPLGEMVERGDPIGKLGNVHPRREIADHVHYSVISPQGWLLDPTKLLFDESGAVQQDFYNYYFTEMLRDFVSDPAQSYDNLNPPDVSDKV